MKQRTEHLVKGDLVVINRSGLYHTWEPAVFIKASDVSITFIPFTSNSDKEHIRIRRSTQQRIYKITQDNLSLLDLEDYLNTKNIILNEDNSTSTT